MTLGLDELAPAPEVLIAVFLDTEQLFPPADCPTRADRINDYRALVVAG